MVTRSEQAVKLVTGKINGQDVTAPAGTTILEAARMAGIEVPNLCYQPLLRPWGSCRICTVEILGKRGGLIESCATPLGEGMEVLTHSEPCVDARQFVLQNYLIDHALDCPTCDKSGECYLQDNTYLHNVNTNPYRRPKLAAPYVHFRDTIDYKWDRCIMCNRCTRVCDEVIGVIAIESTYRALEASISPAYGIDLRETTCTNCGMCIAVCPVGALTDRHFGHHPWELDTTETICGYCDVGCTLNVESNKGIVRRVTNLWERGVNKGYTCEKGKWGHELLQHPDRLFYPRVNAANRLPYEVTWPDAIDAVAEGLSHYQGDQFAALVSGDSTNEEAYVLQQFTRAVMNTNNVDRHLSSSQVAVEEAVRTSLGADIANTNSMQELFSDIKSAMLVGPDIGATEPVASYWFYLSRGQREAKMVVVSQEEYPMCRRGDVWLKPAPGTTAAVLNGIARQIIDLGLASSAVTNDQRFGQWKNSLAGYDDETVRQLSGVSREHLREAAILYATGGAGIRDNQPGDGFPPALIYQTVAHQGEPGIETNDGDPAEIAAVCNNLAILTGNFGRAGGGVASLRGPANYQGTTDMGAHPVYYPGGGSVEDDSARKRFETGWLTRWAERAKTTNGFLPVRQLPSTRGLGVSELVEAIDRGQVKAMFIDGSIAGRTHDINPALTKGLTKLEFLVVSDYYNSPITQMATVVLPKATSLEKDGTFTSFDRTVQRVRAAVPALGEAKSIVETISLLSQRMGYGLENQHPAQIMTEIAIVAPSYGGVTYARLERGGLSAPVSTFIGQGTPILQANGSEFASFNPRLIPTS
ncbi:MAG: molybdopterin-dependent oxidoreductase [Thermomicrobiales bacterium]